MCSVGIKRDPNRAEYVCDLDIYAHWWKVSFDVIKAYRIAGKQYTNSPMWQEEQSGGSSVMDYFSIRCVLSTLASRAVQKHWEQSENCDVWRLCSMRNPAALRYEVQPICYVWI